MSKWIYVLFKYTRKYNIFAFTIDLHYICLNR